MNTTDMIIIRFSYAFHIFTGDITQKGYEKKRTRLLTPYIPQQQTQGKFNLITLTIKRNIAANTDAWTNNMPYMTHTGTF